MFTLNLNANVNMQKELIYEIITFISDYKHKSSKSLKSTAIVAAQNNVTLKWLNRYFYDNNASNDNVKTM